MFLIPSPSAQATLQERNWTLPWQTVCVGPSAYTCVEQFIYWFIPIPLLLVLLLLLLVVVVVVVLVLLVLLFHDEAPLLLLLSYRLQFEARDAWSCQRRGKPCTLMSSHTFMLWMYLGHKLFCLVLALLLESRCLAIFFFAKMLPAVTLVLSWNSCQVQLVHLSLFRFEVEDAKTTITSTQAAIQANRREMIGFEGWAALCRVSETGRTLMKLQLPRAKRSSSLLSLTCSCTYWPLPWPKKRPLKLCINQNTVPITGYRKIKLDCASVCSDARSRGQPHHRANLLITLILRDQNSVLILCIILVAVFFFFWPG